MKKIAAILLSALVVFSAAAVLPMNASAAEITSASASAVMTEGDCSYIVLDDNTVQLTYIANTDGKDIEIPSTIDGRNVTVLESADKSRSICNAKNVTIPDTVTTIGEAAFCCSNLQTLTMTDSVKTIGQGAFFLCSSLKTIRLSNALTQIASDTFNGCRSLERIDIPEGVTTIGSAAFMSCSSLRHLTIPASVTEIEPIVIYCCSGLEDIAIMGMKCNLPYKMLYDSSNPLIYCRKGSDAEAMAKEFNYAYFTFDQPELDVRLLYDGTCEITGVERSVESLNIPAAISFTDQNGNVVNKEVNAVYGSAFRGLGNLRYVSLPSSIKSLDSYAFADCPKLQYVKFSGSGLTQLANYTFCNCPSLEKVDLPETITTAGDGAFMNCPLLTSVKNTQNISSLGNKAFEGCSSLESVDVSSVQNIGSYTFYRCTSLNQVTMSKAKGIDLLAFGGCKALQAVTIPQSVATIHRYAFSTSGLKTINGTQGSYAETFAKTNGFVFKAL